MNCDHISEIHAYHDGELAADRIEGLERHLATCGSCRAELAELRELSARVSSAALAAPSAIAVQRLVRSGRVTQERSIRRLAGCLTAAAAAIVMVATVTRPQAPAPVQSAGGVDLLALDSMGEPLPETLLAAQWMALDLGAVARGGVEQ